MKTFPDFKYEQEIWDEGFNVIGIDEVGRGAFAGSVAVGGVVFPPDLNKNDKEYLLTLGINDSKKLTPKKRESLSKIIKENALAYHVAFIDVATINKIGIGKATFLGMEEVAKKLFKKVTNPYLLIDALEIPNSKIPQRGIIRGDSLSISIAAASIIAKVARDKLMDELSFKFFQYGLEKNKGYGTKFHRISIGKHGVTELHRTDFCRKYI